MKPLHILDEYRRPDWELAHYGILGDDTCGMFEVLGMRIIASTGIGWDHVSVSLANRCPEWQEMEHVKRLFFTETETAMQLHLPPSEHISLHPYCLHLWRPQNAEIPRPPAIMVA